MRLIILFIYLLIVIISLAFAALNATPVLVKLYWASFELPLAFIMVASFGAGLLLGAILFFGKYFGLSHAYYKSKNKVNMLEKEIKNLRSIPIQDSH